MVNLDLLCLSLKQRGGQSPIFMCGLFLNMSGRNYTCFMLETFLLQNFRRVLETYRNFSWILDKSTFNLIKSKMKFIESIFKVEK